MLNKETDTFENSPFASLWKVDRKESDQRQRNKRPLLLSSRTRTWQEEERQEELEAGQI